MFKRFLIFAFLLAGVIEAKTEVDKNNDDKLTISGAYNTFRISGCETSDNYKQASVKVNYDKKVHKNWEVHTSAAYAKTVRYEHKFFGSNEDRKDEVSDSHPTLIDSGFGTVGLSFRWTYLRIRGDFKLMANHRKYAFRDDELEWLPMGGGLIEAGKMDMIWVSTGVLHPEYPYGMFQIALNGNIENIMELGGGAVWMPVNPATFYYDDSADGLSFFLRMRALMSDNFALTGFFNVKPFADTKMMFEGSLGMQFAF